MPGAGPQVGRGAGLDQNISQSNQPNPMILSEQCARCLQFVAIFEAAGEEICHISQDAFRSKLETVGLLSMAGVGGSWGPQRGPLCQAGPTICRRQPRPSPFSPLPNSGGETATLPKTRSQCLLSPTWRKGFLRNRGPEYVPILVNHFTSSEANASQNQEQLKRESSQATGELSKINQKSSALALEVRLIMRADLLALLPLSFISQVR